MTVQLVRCQGNLGLGQVKQRLQILMKSLSVFLLLLHVCLTVVGEKHPIATDLAEQQHACFFKRLTAFFGFLKIREDEMGFYENVG